MKAVNNDVGTIDEKEQWVEWNTEIIDDLQRVDYKSIVVYSRDWTIETIFNQISIGNIDLNPRFQRRNAWNDERRSKLIESLVLGLPVPEVVLAEDPQRKKSFIVIDGKQRLLTIAGFMDPEQYKYWTKDRLTKLTVRQDLNGINYGEMCDDGLFPDIGREFLNADIRCTVISNYKETDVLYDIFYRLNTGSVPLSTQELRQVLNKGPFADYLYKITENPQPIHVAMGIKGPDDKLYDVELALRFIAISLFGNEYKGNLKYFLDNCMQRVNSEWDHWEPEIGILIADFNNAIRRLVKVFGENKIGRRFSNNRYRSFNKVIFEVQAFYFMRINDVDLTKENISLLRDNYKKLCEDDGDFVKSISVSTKDLSQYRRRFTAFRDYINTCLDTNITEVPILLEK